MIGNVRVGNLILVEFNPVPTLVLRVGPRVNDRDARHREFVRLHVRKFVYTDCFQTKFSNSRLQSRSQILRITFLFQNKRACVELLIADFERILSSAHLHVFQAETERRERVVSVVINDVCHRRSRTG